MSMIGVGGSAHPHVTRRVTPSPEVIVNESRSAHPLRREVRILEVYAVCSAIAIVVLLLAVFRSSDHLRLDTLDVGRINVLHDSGLLALSIAGHGRLPGPHFEGQGYPQELSGGRTRATGMIFFNERGDEVGGLTYNGQLTEDGYRAGGGLTFDQFRQDQVVSLQYQDNGSSRAAGVHVWDRTTEVSIGQILELVEARRTAEGAARDSVEAAIRDLERSVGWLAAHRIFLGSQDRTAILSMQDRAGKVRIRMYVDSLDVARLEFLDAEGQVTSAFPR
jgi:hypothetical protein